MEEYLVTVIVIVMVMVTVDVTLSVNIDSNGNSCGSVWYRIMVTVVAVSGTLGSNDEMKMVFNEPDKH